MRSPVVPWHRRPRNKSWLCGIENRLFWVKDVTLREDQGRIRSGRAAFVMSIIRNATINYIRSSGNECIAAALRSNVLRIPALLTRLGILIQ